MSTPEVILDLDQNEQVLQTIKRHPIGLIAIYVVGALAVILTLFLLFIAVRSDDFLINLSNTGYALLFGAVVALISVFTYIGGYVYKSNELVITTENIIQVLQYSLLSRQISQLNLAKIQDVSVDKFGFFSTFLDYGTIEIETAGEASNFRFPYTPDPNRVAKIVIEAHEDYMRQRGNSHHGL